MLLKKGILATEVLCNVDLSCVINAITHLMQHGSAAGCVLCMKLPLMFLIFEEGGGASIQDKLRFAFGSETIWTLMMSEYQGGGRSTYTCSMMPPCDTFMQTVFQSGDAMQGKKGERFHPKRQVDDE